MPRDRPRRTHSPPTNHQPAKSWLRLLKYVFNYFEFQSQKKRRTRTYTQTRWTFFLNVPLPENQSISKSTMGSMSIFVNDDWFEDVSEC